MRLTVLVALGLALAGGTAHATTDAVAKIRLVSVTTSGHVVTVPTAPGLPRNETPRGAVREVDRLYNSTRQFGRAKSIQVGSDTALLVHFVSGRVWITCAAKLPGGMVFTRGDLRTVGGESIAPVIGGTGRYARTHGTLEIRNVGTTAFAANIYTLAR